MQHNSTFFSVESQSLQPDNLTSIVLHGQSMTNDNLPKITARFTGHSLSSACSSILKNVLNNKEKISDVVSSDQTLNRTPLQSEVIEAVTDAEDDGDQSDICSLPECDSDLLGKDMVNYNTTISVCACYESFF